MLLKVRVRVRVKVRVRDRVKVRDRVRFKVRSQDVLFASLAARFCSIMEVSKSIRMSTFHIRQ